MAEKPNFTTSLFTTWFTSDLHLGHANIIEYCDRPYHSVNEMNADLVNRWNQRVADGDVVYVIGDFAMGQLDESLKLVEQMNGVKILIPGNHDKMFRRHGTAYADAVKRYLDAGFSEVHYESTMDMGPWTASHFPFRGDGEEYDSRYLEYRPPDEGQLLIHGHVHGKWRKLGRMVDVGVDAWCGYPVASDDIMAVFDHPSVRIDPEPWVA